MRGNFFIIIICIFLLAAPRGAIHATPDASLYLSPASKAVLAGQNFSVTVFVSSITNALNAAEGKIIFPADRLEVAGISKSGSIFVFWPEEPASSNQDGIIRFAGGLPTPGYVGEQGKIITITFRAKSIGAAEVKFESGAILADDGKGTNLLSSFGNGSYRIQAATVPLPPAPSELYAPETPVVQIEMRKSALDEWARYLEGLWIRLIHIRFSWKIPKDAAVLAYEFDNKPETDPQNIFINMPTEAVYENVKDGIWFFHIKFKNKNGWSKVVHRKTQIDTASPRDFEFKIDNGGDETNPQPKLIFSAVDELSGVDHFEIKIDEGEFQIVEGNEFITPVLPAGKHNLFILAEDKAGNRVLKTGTLAIKSIEPPKIDLYPWQLYKNELLYLGGTAATGTKISLYFKSDGKTDSLGQTCGCDNKNWYFVYSKRLGLGEYRVWAVAEDSRGAKSEAGGEVSIFIVPMGFVVLGPWQMEAVSIIKILLAVIAILILTFSVYRIAVWRKLLAKRFRKIKK